MASVEGAGAPAVEREDANLINFTTIKYDPLYDLKSEVPPIHGIYRRPRRSELLIEYLYCLFVGLFSIVLNPFSFGQLWFTAVTSLFWTLALICVFYRRNIIVNMISAIMTKVVWAQTFLAIHTVLNGYSEANKSLFLNILILVSNVVIYMGMAYSKHITVKSFDGSTVMLVTLFGGFLGMGLRFLFHFLTAPWLLVYGILTFLVLAGVFPFVYLRCDKSKASRILIICCTVLYLLCMILVYAFYWTEAHGNVKSYIFSARNNDPIMLTTIVDHIKKDIQKGMFKHITEPKLFSGNFPKLTIVIHWCIGTLFDILFGIIKAFLEVKALYFPLYYQIQDKYVFDQFSSDVRSIPAYQLRTSDQYAERDAVFVLCLMGTVLTGFMVTIAILWFCFQSLRQLHQQTIESMLMPATERMKIDPDMYLKRISITTEKIRALNAMEQLAPNLMTEEQKLLSKLISSGGMMTQK